MPEDAPVPGHAGSEKVGRCEKGVGQLEQPFEKHHVHGCSNHTERRFFWGWEH